MSERANVQIEDYKVLLLRHSSVSLLRFEQIVQKVRCFVYKGRLEGLERISVARVEGWKVNLGGVW